MKDWIKIFKYEKDMYIYVYIYINKRVVFKYDL